MRREVQRRILRKRTKKNKQQEVSHARYTPIATRPGQ